MYVADRACMLLTAFCGYMCCSTDWPTSSPAGDAPGTASSVHSTAISRQLSLRPILAISQLLYDRLIPSSPCCAAYSPATLYIGHHLPSIKPVLKSYRHSNQACIGYALVHHCCVLAMSKHEDIVLVCKERSEEANQRVSPRTLSPFAECYE
jgi:hypothetical protein